MATVTIVVQSADTAAMAEAIAEHPSVAEALVTDPLDGGGAVVWIVPDRRHAPMLLRSAVIEGEGRLGVLSWHEPADDLRVAGINRGETDFLYREIFVDDAYFPSGVGLPPDAVVVDVGANIGMFTLRAARHSPTARVIAVEPVAELAGAVQINAELHGLDVRAVCAALGAEQSEAEFTFYPRNTVMSGRFADMAEDRSVLKGYLLTGAGASTDSQLDRLVSDSLATERRCVPVTTLTSVADEYGLDRIDLLKIDVEKAEMEVLQGIDDRLWPRIMRAVLEVHDLDGRLDAVLALLRHHGFRACHTQNPRLALTRCYTVHAHRPGTASAPPPLDPGTAAGGPTLRKLESDLRATISQRHPQVPQPGRFVVVANLSTVAGRASTLSRTQALGSTPRTAALVDAWRALFGPASVRPDADFFELGGTSLGALQILKHVEGQLGPGLLNAETIFVEATLGALASAIEEASNTGNS
jgi:FkbM family methyltransferase